MPNRIGDVNISKILFETKNHTREIDYKIQIINSNKNPPWPETSLLIPKWSIFMITGTLILLCVVLVGAAVTLFGGRQPGEYLEDCNYRSCNSKQALKCIQSVCKCTSNEYFLKKCHTKKSINEFCGTSIDECKSEFECFNGKCSCNRTHYWNGQKCTNKAKLSETCGQRPCDDTLMLTCDASSKVCVCNSTSRFWNSMFCSLRRTIDERCVDTSNCLASKGLTCVNGTCQCNKLLEYFDYTHNLCLKRKQADESCVDTRECLGDMLCTSGKCNCLNTSTHYFNDTSLLCTQKTLNNTSCVSTVSCRSDLGLRCTFGLCLCDAATHFWNGATCNSYRLHGLSCTSTSACEPDQFTMCINGLCQCNWTMFFNVSTQVCNNRKPWNSPCVSSNECQHYNRFFCSRVSRTCITCPLGWSMNSSYCFYYSNSSLSASAADNWCTQQNAILLNFLTTADYNFFSTITVNDPYIGLFKLNSAAPWLWTFDNSVFSDTHAWWAGGNPGSSDTCATLNPNHMIVGRSACGTLRDFVCQIR